MHSRRYSAFISYRHADNTQEGRRWAEWLHRALERYTVPSQLAEGLARSIHQSLSGKRPVTAPTLAVTPAAITPKPAKLNPVPAEFLHLRGEHEAHLGTGKGPSYRIQDKPLRVQVV